MQLVREQQIQGDLTLLPSLPGRRLAPEMVGTGIVFDYALADERMEDRTAGLQQPADNASLPIVPQDGEFHGPALVRLGRARKQAQPEAARIAVFDRFERESAKHLPAELDIAEACLMSGIGNQRQHFARLLAMAE